MVSTSSKFLRNFAWGLLNVCTEFKSFRRKENWHKHFTIVHTKMSNHTCAKHFEMKGWVQNLIIAQQTNIFEKTHNLSPSILTLSLLGYLKTRIRSKSHVWCPNITNDTSLESSFALLLESAKKFANLQKLNFLCKIQFYSKNLFFLNCPKNDKLYIF